MNLYLKLGILTLGLISINACTPKHGLDGLPDPDADIKQVGLESAAPYIELANNSTGIVRNTHLLKATQLLIQHRNYQEAQNQLVRIQSELLDRESQIEVLLLQAEIDLNNGLAREALRRLSTTDILKPEQQIRLMQLRARAFLSAGYPFESAKTRVQLDTLLSEPFDRELNHQAIWEALSLLPKTSLQQASIAPLHKDLLGWVELAKIAKGAQIDWQHLQDGIYRWRKEYPKHPAADTFIKDLGFKQIELIDRPSHIAVLLPLNGKYAQVAAAIREGILSSYYLHPDQSFKPRISFINTGDNQSAIWNYYRQATDMGADFIIGPFLKSAVDNLARGTELNIPTLTLNYASDKPLLDPSLDTDSANTESPIRHEQLFQFGLLPEDEAHQSAEMAFRQGRTHAAVLVPEGEWGERLAQAFQQRFEALGGKVISKQVYTPNSNDFKQPIQTMLNIRQSYSRYNAIQNVMRMSMKFTPYRRQDVDMIFMAATPRDARQLKPQFKFHYAGEIPVYATSHAFSGQLNKQADRDIDDLSFCDMPWILNAPDKFKQSLINYWPEQQRYTRFFALGVDAYNLIPFLGRLQGKSYERFSGQTGNLYLDAQNRVHRELLWAQFEKGIPKLLDINNMPESFALDETQTIQSAIQ